MGDDRRGTHTYPTATHPQHPQTRHPPPTAPLYCNASSSGAGDPSMKPTLDSFNGFVFVFIDFLIVLVFVSGQHLGFPLLNVTCSSSGSFKAFLDRDGRIYLFSLLFISPLCFPSLILQKVAGTKVSAEKTYRMRVFGGRVFFV